MYEQNSIKHEGKILAKYIKDKAAFYLTELWGKAKGKNANFQEKYPANSGKRGINTRNRQNLPPAAIFSTKISQI